jgi:hypothetical protein
MSRGYREFWDPAGERFGLPTWPWRMAPAGLATRRQLTAAGLRPAGQPPAGQVCWFSRRRSPGHRPRTRFALLYRVELAAPRREATQAQLVALAKADSARRTCSSCGRVLGYVVPRSLGECLDCHDGRAAGAGTAA